MFSGSPRSSKCWLPLSETLDFAYLKILVSKRRASARRHNHLISGVLIMVNFTSQYLRYKTKKATEYHPLGNVFWKTCWHVCGVPRIDMTRQAEVWLCSCLYWEHWVWVKTCMGANLARGGLWWSSGCDNLTGLQSPGIQENTNLDGGIKISSRNDWSPYSVDFK